MASKTQIVNIALSRIGSGKQVTNVDTGRDRESIQSRTLFDDDVLYVLRDFPWPWATAYADLALVSGSATEMANPDWRYAYRYPSDCVYARRIAIEGLGRSNAEPPPFRLGRDAQGRLIFTNEETASLEFTITISEPSEFDPMFVSQLAWKLAAGLAPSLSRIKGMAATCMEMYEIDKTKAQSRALNESEQEEPNEAEMIRARE